MRIYIENDPDIKYITYELRRSCILDDITLQVNLKNIHIEMCSNDKCNLFLIKRHVNDSDKDIKLWLRYKLDIFINTIYIVKNNYVTFDVAFPNTIAASLSFTHNNTTGFLTIDDMYLVTQHTTSINYLFFIDTLCNKYDYLLLKTQDDINTFNANNFPHKEYVKICLK